MMLRSLKTIVSYQSLVFNKIFNFGIVKFNLPDLGQKIKEGTIKKLYIKQGDIVQQFQKLADVASDKQFTEITAGDSGIIRKIHFFEEDICQVGQLFLQIEVQDGKEQKTSQETVSKVQTKQQKQEVELNKNSGSSVKSSADGAALTTPYIRGLIKKYNLNIEQIEGSGPNGRITQADVNAIIQGKRDQKRTPSIQFGKRGQPQEEQRVNEVKTKQVHSGKFSHVPGPQSSHHFVPKQTKGHVPPPLISLSTQQKSEVKKMSLFEKGMQKSMAAACQIPHLYFHEQYDLTECQKLRKTLKASNKKVTVMGLLIKTFSLALRKYPRMNSTYYPEQNQFEYKVHQNHNISIAIDSPNGLVVPNIKNTQTLNLLNIQHQIQRLRHLAVEARLTGTELSNGTVCISNIGTIGGILANPLILAPQVCIVAIGKLQTVAKFKDGLFVPRNVINVSFGCDHRIIDGATVARFSNQWKSLLQNPYIAMAQMI